MNWVTFPGNPDWSIPAIGEDGSVYVIGAGREDFQYTTDTDTLYAYTPELELKWKVTLEYNLSNPVIGPSGTIYVASSWGSLHAFSPSGTNLWTFVRPRLFSFSSVHSASVAISSDEIIYSTYGQADAARVDAVKDGALVRTITNSSNPVIGPDGTIYVARWTPPGHLAALTSDGTEKWSAPYPAPNAIDSEGNLFICSTNTIVSLSAAGTVRWEQPAAVWGVALGSNDTLYVASRGGTSALDADTGSILWRDLLSGTICPRADGGVSILHVGGGGYREPYPGVFKTLGASGETKSEYSGNGVNQATVQNIYSWPVRGSSNDVYFVYGISGGGNTTSILVRVPNQDAPADSLAIASGQEEIVLKIKGTAGIQLQVSTNLLDWHVLQPAEADTNLVRKSSSTREFFRLSR